MDHSRSYYKLIAKRQESVIEGEYREHHHVIPKALGGSDDDSNLVYLSAREHYIAHLLLAKIYGGPMIHALTFMNSSNRHQERPSRKGSRMYEWARREHAKLASIQGKSRTGKRNGAFGSYWITNGTMNRRLNSDESIPSGFKRGRCGTFHPKKRKSIRSYVWWYDDHTQTNTILPRDSEPPSNWKRGRKNFRELKRA